jgi:exodeoxyribonuclease V alpha subunit
MNNTAPIITREVMTGVIKKLISNNQDDNLIIAKFMYDRAQGLCVRIAGYNLPLPLGEKLEITGEWTRERKYRRLFVIHSFQVLSRPTLIGIKNYLISLKGVGKRTAAKIIKNYGRRTLDFIYYAPADLRTIKGIGPKKVTAVLKGFKVKEVYLI